MYKRILIPLDGSPIAEQALPLAKMLAVRFSSSVILFQAIQPISERVQAQAAAVHAYDQIEPQRKQALEYLETIAHSFPHGLFVRQEVRIGLPATAIFELAESAHVDLIAMATHGRTGLQRWIYGSVADKVLSGARSPILLVRASQAPSAITPISRILVPLDGSTLAERALLPAQHLARAFDAELLLFHAHEPSAYLEGGLTAGIPTAAFDEALRAVSEEYLTEKTRELRSQGVRVRWEMHFGRAADSILDMAQRHEVNLVAMATHGRSGVGRWIMGSVADRVLRASRIPVLLIRSGAVVE